jgi:outer membrane protein TolC
MRRVERRKGSHYFYVLFLSLIVDTTLAHAQGIKSADAPTQVLKLTLDQAVALALKQNPTAQIAILTAAQSEQDKNIARADLLPQVNATISDEAQKVNLLAQFGGKVALPGFPKTIGPYQLFSAGPTFGGPVFDLTLWKRYQAARETMSASKANSLSTREQVILLVVSQYIGTLRAVANAGFAVARGAGASGYDRAADLPKREWERH